MFEDFEINAVNDSLREYEKRYSPDSFIRFLSTTKRYKCSVTGQYLKVPEENVVRINEWRNPACDCGDIYDIDIKLADVSGDDYYHGLAPAFTAEAVKLLIQKGGFRNIGTLLSFLKKYKAYYNWVFPVESSSSYGIEEFYIYTIIKMAGHFGYKFTFKNKETLNAFKDAIAEGRSFIDGVTYSLDGNVLTFIGGPCDEMLSLLDNFSFTSDGTICLKGAAGSYSFSLFYELQKEDGAFIHPHMLGNNSYYSGVIARLMKIDAPSSPEDGNNNIRVMRLFTGRTTFATLDAFDYGNLVTHPLLRFPLEGDEHSIADTVRKVRKEEYERMSLLFSYDNSKEEGQSHARTLLNLINRYLSSSINSNTIAVSANLTTRDGCLIGAVRNRSSIDTGTCYCSSNGQMEFRDNLVTFYRNSVYVDLPSLSVPKGLDAQYERLDFTKEIERETIAELNTSHFSATWMYYGISVLGVVNRIGDGSGATRLHFNVLSENTLLDDFIDVCEFRNEATESFENNRLIGLKPVKLSAFISVAVTWLIDHCDFITNLILVFLVLYERLVFNAEGDPLDFSLAAVFIFLELVYLIGSFVRYRRKKKRTKAKSVYVRGMILKEKWKKGRNDDEKKMLLMLSLFSSVEKLKRKMEGLRLHYSSTPHSILVLMYELNALHCAIEDE